MDRWPKLLIPKELKESSLSGTVFSIDGDDDIKPSLAVINDREMLLFTNHSHREYVSHFSEEQKKCMLAMELHTVMYRTQDGGSTWKCCGHMPFHGGYEASATVIGGVVYVQTHEFPNISENHKNLIARIFCSTNKGDTWYETRVDSEFLGVSQQASICLDRNFIQLKDGCVAGFVSVEDGGRGFTMRLTTKDEGRSWTVQRVEERGVYGPDRSLTPLLEAFFFRTPKTGRLMAISRVVWSQFTEDQITQIPNAVSQKKHADIDSLTGLLLLESKDEGLSWDPVQGLGYLSMMYPSVVYLDDENFLLTYTIRSDTTDAPYPHTGLQAVLGKELPDGSFTIAFNQDIIVIDDRTPDHAENGSAFGITNRLSDGSFVSPYSYRISTPSFDEMLKEAAFNDRDAFRRYYEKTKLKRDYSGFLNHFSGTSYDLRRHMFNSIAEERLESYCKTEMLKWKLNR